MLPPWKWNSGLVWNCSTPGALRNSTPNLQTPGAAAAAGLVELVDVFPTLAELASLPAPQGLDGRSLVPMLANPQAPGRVAVLSQFARPFKASTPEVMGYSLRTPTHRYTRWITLPARKLVAEELYTYTTGPSTRREGAFWIEQENLAPHPSQADTRQALSQKLDQILTERITSQSQPQLAPRKQKRKDTQP